MQIMCPADSSGWCYVMARTLSHDLDMDAFGVKGLLYLIGSVEWGTAGIYSDIDLLVHIVDKADVNGLLSWLEHWDQYMCGVYKRLTEIQMNRILDIHIVTDDDLKCQDSFATHIHSSWQPAERLKSNGRE